MNKVDAEVGKEQKHWELSVIVPATRSILESIVELRVPPDFGKEEWDGENCDPGHSIYGLADFHPDLVFEKLRVLIGSFIENEDIGEG